MKLLLINCPQRNRESKVINLGLAYLSACIEKRGIEIDSALLDLALDNADKNFVRQALRENTCDVYGISAFVTDYTFVEWLVGEIRLASPGSIVIIGGGLASSIPQLVTENIGADYAFVGECEDTLPVFLEALEKNEEPPLLPGMFPKNASIPPPAERSFGVVHDVDSLPFPHRDLFDMEGYFRNQDKDSESGRFLTIIGSRGCVFSCVFCERTYRGNYRLRDPEKLIEEIKMIISRYGNCHLTFLDELFVFNNKYISDFCSLLKRENISITWEANTKPGYIDRKLLERVARAGCLRLGIGVESGSQKILDKINKRMKLDQIYQSLKDIKAVGIEPLLSFIIGLPGETGDTLRETRDFCLRIKEFNPLPFSFYFVQPYPGTRLFDYMVKEGYMKDDLESFIRSLSYRMDLAVNFTSLSDEELIEKKEILEEELNREN